jgi:hypothetical protein
MKTGLAVRGIMSITIGMIDPSWTGPISVLLVNFSERDVHLEQGEEFLRVTFHEHAKANGPPKYPQPTSGLGDVYHHYVEERRREVRILPATFLNLKGHGDELADATRKGLTAGALQIATFAALLLAFGAILIPIGTDAVRNLFMPEITNPLADDLRALEARVHALEVQQAAAKNPGQD